MLQGIDILSSILQLLDLKMESKLLSYLITTDDIANGFDDVEDDAKRLRECETKEILCTVNTYRYGCKGQ